MIGYGIAILAGVGLAIAGTICLIMADGKRRQKEYDRAWRQRINRDEIEK